MKPCVIKRLNIPDNEKTPPTTEQTEGEQMCETPKSKVPKPEQWQDYDCQWIRPGTWVIVDQKVNFRKGGYLTMAEGRRLNRQIKASLKADRIKRIPRTGEALMGSLTSSDFKEA